MSVFAVHKQLLAHLPTEANTKLSDNLITDSTFSFEQPWKRWRTLSAARRDGIGTSGRSPSEFKAPETGPINKSGQNYNNPIQLKRKFIVAKSVDATPTSRRFAFQNLQA